MADEIQEIRAELDDIRAKALAFFADVEQLFPGQGGPVVELQVPEDLHECASRLRRRTGAAMGRIAQLLNGSPSFSDAVQKVFWRTFEVMQAALEFHRYQPDADAEIQSLSVAGSRKVWLCGCQYAKIRLAAFSGYSHYTPQQPGTTPCGTLAPQASPEAESSVSSPANSRRQQVEAFIKFVSEQGQRKIIRKDVWRVAGYKRARQFEHWQAGDEKATHSDSVNFPRVLAMKPADFVTRLDQLAKKSKP